MGERVAIIGSRKWADLLEVAEYVLGLPVGTEVVSGGAAGVDSTAETAAKFRGLLVTVFLPDWAKYGRSAGMIRNKEIVRHADRAIAFWDGQSRGTAGCIELFRKAGKPVDVRRRDG